MTTAFDFTLLLALLFFLFLPITDRRTVMMRLAMMAVIAALFAGSVMMASGLSLPSHLSQDVVMSN